MWPLVCWIISNRLVRVFWRGLRGRLSMSLPGTMICRCHGPHWRNSGSGSEMRFRIPLHRPRALDECQVVCQQGQGGDITSMVIGVSARAAPMPPEFTHVKCYEVLCLTGAIAMLAMPCAVAVGTYCQDSVEMGELAGFGTGAEAMPGRGDPHSGMPNFTLFA